MRVAQLFSAWRELSNDNLLLENRLRFGGVTIPPFGPHKPNGQTLDTIAHVRSVAYFEVCDSKVLVWSLRCKRWLRRCCFCYFLLVGMPGWCQLRHLLFQQSQNSKKQIFLWSKEKYDVLLKRQTWSQNLERLQYGKFLEVSSVLFVWIRRRGCQLW